MSTLIKIFSDGSILEYDKGAFDDWCVYLTRPGVRRYAPKDSEYFAEIQVLSKIYGVQKIYADFVRIYDATGQAIDPKTLHLIDSLSDSYGSDQLEIQILFTILYAGMIAEENKKYKVLGKRLKRLGMHQILVEGLAPELAAIFSKGKRAAELNQECKKRGF